MWQQRLHYTRYITYRPTCNVRIGDMHIFHLKMYISAFGLVAMNLRLHGPSNLVHVRQVCSFGHLRHQSSSCLGDGRVVARVVTLTNEPNRLNGFLT